MLPGINQKFWFIPSKVGIKASFLLQFGGTIGEKFANIYQVYVFL